MKNALSKLDSHHKAILLILTKVIPSARINGDKQCRLPNTSSISFMRREADKILAGLGNIAASAGAACHAEEVKISHVLSAMHVPDLYAKGTIRLSTGRMTTREEIQNAAENIVAVVNSQDDCD